MNLLNTIMKKLGFISQKELDNILTEYSISCNESHEKLFNAVNNQLDLAIKKAKQNDEKLKQQIKELNGRLRVNRTKASQAVKDLNQYKKKAGKTLAKLRKQKRELNKANEAYLDRILCLSESNLKHEYTIKLMASYQDMIEQELDKRVFGHSFSYLNSINLGRKLANDSVDLTKYKLVVINQDNKNA